MSLCPSCERPVGFARVCPYCDEAVPHPAGWLEELALALFFIGISVFIFVLSFFFDFAVPSVSFPRCGTVQYIAAAALALHQLAAWTRKCGMKAVLWTTVATAAVATALLLVPNLRVAVSETLTHHLGTPAALVALGLLATVRPSRRERICTPVHTDAKARIRHILSRHVALAATMLLAGAGALIPLALKTPTAVLAFAGGFGALDLAPRIRARLYGKAWAKARALGRMSRAEQENLEASLGIGGMPDSSGLERGAAGAICLGIIGAAIMPTAPVPFAATLSLGIGLGLLVGHAGLGAVPAGAMFLSSMLFLKSTGF